MLYTLASGSLTNISAVNAGNQVATSGEKTGAGMLTHTFSGLDDGTYTVFAVDGLGCEKHQTITLSDPSPITVNLTSTTACVGNRITFTATPSGGLASTAFGYKWYRSNDGGTTFTQVDNQDVVEEYNVTSQQSNVTMRAEAYSLTAECSDVYCKGQNDLTVNLSSVPILTMANQSICPSGAQL
jgi:hypothetical protein